MPPFRGRATRDALNKHIQTKVADWVRRKREAIELAEKEYMKILRLEPVPPPQWVIASGARVGQLWDHYVTEFRATPIPDEWKSNGVLPGTKLTFAELRKSYMRSLEEALEPQRQQAKAAFRTCLDYSVKFQYFDSYARICREWLSERYPQEYPVIREIFPPAGKLAFSIPSSPVTPATGGESVPE
jgi:hypothetical protein